MKLLQHALQKKKKNETADVITFTEETFNGKLLFLYSDAQKGKN